MKAATREIIKRQRRTAETGHPVLVRLQADDLELLDLWIAANDAGMTRPEAMRRILKLVAVRMPAPPQSLGKGDRGA